LCDSGGQDALGVLAKTFDSAADKTTRGFGSDTEIFADFTEALALTIDETKTSLDGVAGALIERAEQFAEQFAVDQRHDSVFRGALAVVHEVAKGGVTVIAHGLVE